MRMAIVEHGVVTNIAESERPLDSRFVPSASAEIGDLWDGKQFKKADSIKSVTRRQGRRALLERGYFQAVEGYIASIADETERMRAQIDYEADTWERANPWVNHMLELLGLTPEQGDELFKLAVTF